MPRPRPAFVAGPARPTTLPLSAHQVALLEDLAILRGVSIEAMAMEALDAGIDELFAEAAARAKDDGRASR